MDSIPLVFMEINDVDGCTNSMDFCIVPLIPLLPCFSVLPPQVIPQPVLGGLLHRQ